MDSSCLYKYKVDSYNSRTGKPSLFVPSACGRSDTGCARCADEPINEIAGCVPGIGLLGGGRGRGSSLINGVQRSLARAGTVSFRSARPTNENALAIS